MNEWSWCMFQVSASGMFQLRFTSLDLHSEPALTATNNPSSSVDRQQSNPHQSSLPCSSSSSSSPVRRPAVWFQLAVSGLPARLSQSLPVRSCG